MPEKIIKICSMRFMNWKLLKIYHIIVQVNITVVQPERMFSRHTS